jgi:hypothetical protein
MTDLTSPECVRHAAWIARGVLDRRATNPDENCAEDIRILADAADRVIREMTALIPTAIERKTV